MFDSREIIKTALRIWFHGFLQDIINVRASAIINATYGVLTRNMFYCCTLRHVIMQGKVYLQRGQYVKDKCKPVLLWR